jgi:hypothetical protein
MFGSLRPLTYVVLCVAFCCLASRTLCPADEPEEQTAKDLPAILSAGWPRAFFFRGCEGPPTNPRTEYDSWDESFSRLMGIEGKALDEEVPGRQLRNIDFFTQFKNEHPEQLVLLHLNGNARDPRYRLEPYFAGHFIYHNGTTITEDVPAESGETDIKVDDLTLFRLNMGRYQNANDDIGLCMLDSEGRPDWNRSEQVQLISINQAAKTIRVRRGQYGSTPLPFPAGEAYATAHMTEGPWGAKSNIMWYYNYSMACPRDANGRTCADILVEELGRFYDEDGELAAFDGLEFDVLHHQVGGGGRLGADCDADGQIDGGFIGGVNSYGVGVVEFCRALRERMGENRLILADGMAERNQRAFGILNGIESEGWPHLSDNAIDDWSGGLNRHFFWDVYARAPKLNYVNHKFTEAGESPGQRRTPRTPFSTHRLVFAASVFTNSAICYSFAPTRPPEEQFIGIWDELCKGEEKQLGWLGRPQGSAVRTAYETPNILNFDSGSQINFRRWFGHTSPLGGSEITLPLGQTGPVPKFTPHSNQEIEGNDPIDICLIKDIPCDGPDLLVTITASSQKRWGETPEIPRLYWIEVEPHETQLTRSTPPNAEEIGMCLRNSEEQPLDPDSGASVGFSKLTIGEQSVQGYRTHPPYKGGVGYTYWSRTLTVPEEGRLQLVTSMGPLSPERSDGVDFLVYLSPAYSTEPVVEGVKIFEHSQKSYELIPHDVSLANWVGQSIRLSFVADCGPNDNSTTDHAFWGDAVVTGPEGDAERTKPYRAMGWAGRTPFESTFYLRDVKEKRITLRLSVEGTEPIVLSEIRAHAAPDAIYRIYENGIVLANPADHPYEFDLADISPGVRYRRLCGTSLQDPETNNGEAVGDQVELGPRDALFLVRMKSGQTN